MPLSAFVAARNSSLRLKIVGELARRPNGLQQPGRARMHGENAVRCRVTTVVAHGLAVEIIRQGNPSP